ncbi:MAG: nucleoside deaminase [Bacteroidales bacterium]|nr:nucleoside deaminase [Bacteroidales bacterium]MCF8332750.1 nucleoside deaminase [Bacteroidales bacterium]
MEFSVFSDESFMKEALKEAHAAYEKSEVPVGAVIVCDREIVARGHNLTETLNDVTAHAEMQALTAAMNQLGAKYLTECTLFVTLEPCVMCAGAMQWAQIERLVYGSEDDKKGYRLFSGNILHPKTTITKNILSRESKTLLEDFFRKKR